MVIATRLPLYHIKRCPHCGSGFIAVDKQDREPFCCICGWRRATRITEEQARNHFRRQTEFWNNLFASEYDPNENKPGSRYRPLRPTKGING